MRDKNFSITVSDDGVVTRQGQMATAHIHNLKQTHIDLKAQYNGILSDRSRKLTDNDRLRMDAIAQEVAALDQAILVAERAQDLERGESQLRSSPTMVNRSTGRKFAQMFPDVPLSSGGFKSTEDFLATLHSGLADARLLPAYAPRGLQASSTGGVPSEGGFSVPTQMFAQWLDDSLEGEIVRPRADIRPMTSSDAKAVGWDDGDHSTTLYGGFSGQWLAEEGGMTVQTPKLRLINLHARKLGLLASASNELIADGMSFEEQLGQAITKALGWFLDLAFFRGNGASAPVGIHNAPCTITVAKETGQPAGTINYVNLAKMFSRLHPSSYANSVWVVNSTAIPQLLQLSLPIGTAGSAVPVMSESNGKFTILTRPVEFTEKVPSLGTVGDIGLYDFSQYVIGMRAEFQLAKSTHVGFASDTTHYRGIIRVDGQPKLSAPVTPDNGDTLSPFVLLATRA